MQISAPRFSYHFVEVYERFFIPVTGGQTKRMCARPISEIGDGFHVVWSAFAKGPYPHHLYSRCSGLSEGLGHLFAIFIAIHHCNICTHEAKGTSLNLETATISSYELVPRGNPSTRMSAIKEDRRAHSQCERGDHKQFLFHQSQVQKKEQSAGQVNVGWLILQNP